MDQYTESAGPDAEKGVPGSRRIRPVCQQRQKHVPAWRPTALYREGILYRQQRVQGFHLSFFGRGPTNCAGCAKIHRTDAVGGEGIFREEHWGCRKVAAE